MGSLKKQKSHDTKEKIVQDICNEINNSRTLMIVSIKGLRSKQFQEIKKSIRKDAKVKVATKNILVRAIKKVGKKTIVTLEKNIKENCAFIISHIEGFELAALLNTKKTPTFAKAGQIAPADIEIKSGPTDLVPGPAISELGAVGLQISIEASKIHIRQSKVLVKQGEEINSKVSAILQKLNIQPFKIGVETIAVYDTKDETVFTNIVIDKESVLKDLKLAQSRSLGFAQKVAYICKETIRFLLSKANTEANILQTKTQLNQSEGTS
jgi:large subunit ribosomal protein L10